MDRWYQYLSCLFVLIYVLRPLAVAMESRKHSKQTDLDKYA